MRPQGDLSPGVAPLSRRSFCVAGAGALAALVASATPLAQELRAATPAQLPELPPADATLQAFADTIVPGRPATVTDLGNVIHPGAIAGVDSAPGAVEADALVLFHSPFIGFDTLQGAFIADLEQRALRSLRPFLALGHSDRVAVVDDALSRRNPSRLLYQTAATISMSSFVAAAPNVQQTAAAASGYRVMGFPGAAPQGYRNADYSYRRKLSRERTRKGYLP